MHSSIFLFIAAVTEVWISEAFETQFPDPKARVAAGRQQKTDFSTFTPEQGKRKCFKTVMAPVMPGPVLHKTQKLHAYRQSI